MRAAYSYLTGVQVEEDGASCSLSFRGNYWFISSLSTDPKFRRCGHATRMLKQIVRAAKRLGRRVELMCAPYGYERLSLEDTRKFYEKCGFKVIQDSKYSYRMST